MIVIAKKVGRLANRMVLFSHFIGAAQEHGFKVANPAFERYAPYFPTTSRDLLCRFPASSRMISFGFPGRSTFYRMVQLGAHVLFRLQCHGYNTPLIRLRRSQKLDLDGPVFLARLNEHHVLLVQDWFFRSSKDCEKHGAVIRSFFTPWEHHLERSRALVAPARRDGKFVVGVHVRQDDYATFKDGRYFYSHGQYRALMEQVLSAFPDESVAFLVCSDAPVPGEIFAGLDVHYGNGHELEDLYALAECDLLMGPPSTYSRWASFYGEVPRYEIFDPSLTLTPEHFKVSSRLMHQEAINALTQWHAT